MNIGSWFTTRRLMLFLFPLAIVALVVRTYLKPPEHPNVTTAAVTRGDIELGVLSTGTIEAAKLVSVGAQVSGQIKYLAVSLGDQVTKGDLIAEIDSLTQQNSLRSATAALANMRAQRASSETRLRQYELAVKRLRALVAVDAGTQSDLESAEASSEATRADVAALNAQIEEAVVTRDTAKLNLGYTHIVAPMNGTVVAIVTEQGQTLNSSQSAPTIVKLARLDTMTVKAQISEADVQRVKPGMPVYFTLLGDPVTRYQTTLRSVEPGPTDIGADSASRVSSSSNSSSTGSSSASAVYYNGIFDVPNPEGKLRISMTTQSTIVLDKAHNALLVPSAALGTSDAQGTYTVMVMEGERTMPRTVHVGLNNRVQAQVLDGLNEGDQVVTSQASPSSTPTPSQRNRPPPDL